MYNLYEKEIFILEIIASAVSYLNADLKRYYNKELNIKGELKHVYNKLNAWANKKYDDTYIIGMNWGTYIYIDKFW